VDGTGTNGNLILSRHEFAAPPRATRLTPGNRSAAAVEIVVGGRRISIVSTHFAHTSSDAAAQFRRSQAEELESWSDALPEDKIVCADLNADPGAPEVRSLNEPFIDQYALAAARGVAYGVPGGATRRSGRRMDVILCSRAATHLTLTEFVTLDTRNPAGDDPSDHRPILAVFGID
jgi:endonuclease/exonuclease/phosphatase family metal-dependent hydrolase